MKLLKSVLSVGLAVCICWIISVLAVYATGSNPADISEQESDAFSKEEESETLEPETGIAEEPYAVEDSVYEESEIESGMFPRIGEYSGYDPQDESVVMERKRVNDIIAVIIAVVFTAGLVALIVSVKKKKGEKE